MANQKEGIIGPSQADIAAVNKLRGPIRISRVLTAVGAALGIPTSMALIAACTPQRPAEVRPVSTPIAEPANTAIPTEIPPNVTASPIPKPPPTTESTKIPPTVKPTKAATATPEAKKDEPCTILPTEYCSRGQVIDTKNKQGQPVTYVGFRLPVNVPIFAGKDGQVLKAQISQPSVLQGSLATIRDPNLSNPNATAFDTVGDIRFDNMLSVNVKKGDIIGYTQDTGIRNFGDYNLLITISRLDPSIGHAVSAEDILNELFPQAFAKPAETFAYQGPDNPASTILSPLFATTK